MPANTESPNFWDQHSCILNILTWVSGVTTIIALYWAQPVIGSPTYEEVYQVAQPQLRYYILSYAATITAAAGAILIMAIGTIYMSSPRTKARQTCCHHHCD